MGVLCLFLLTGQKQHAFVPPLLSVPSAAKQLSLDVEWRLNGAGALRLPVEIPSLAGISVPNRASVFATQTFIYLETGRQPRQKSLGTGL